MVRGILAVKITVKYLDKSLDKKLEIVFDRFDWFGSWYANSYEHVIIIEIIQEE